MNQTSHRASYQGRSSAWLFLLLVLSVKSFASSDYVVLATGLEAMPGVNRGTFEFIVVGRHPGVETRQ